MEQRFKVMATNSNHSLSIALNILNGDFYSSAKANEKYVGDLTYIATSKAFFILQL
jgi:hypothetical protein